MAYLALSIDHNTSIIKMEPLSPEQEGSHRPPVPMRTTGCLQSETVLAQDAAAESSVLASQAQGHAHTPHSSTSIETSTFSSKKRAPRPRRKKKNQLRQQPSYTKETPATLRLKGMRRKLLSKSIKSCFNNFSEKPSSSQVQKFLEKVSLQELLNMCASGENLDLLVPLIQCGLLKLTPSSSIASIEATPPISKLESSSHQPRQDSAVTVSETSPHSADDIPSSAPTQDSTLSPAAAADLRTTQVVHSAIASDTPPTTLGLLEGPHSSQDSTSLIAGPSVDAHTQHSDVYDTPTSLGNAESAVKKMVTGIAVSVSQLPSTAPHPTHTSHCASSESDEDFLYSYKLRSPVTQSPITLHSPGTQSPITLHLPGTQSPTTLDSPDTESPITLHSPGTQSPTTLHSPGAQSPITLHSPGTQSPTTLDSPCTQPPTTLDSPGTQPPTTLDSPGTQSPTTLDSPGTQPPTTLDSPGTQPPTTLHSPGTQPPTTLHSPGTQPPITLHSPGTQPPITLHSPGTQTQADSQASSAEPCDALSSQRSHMDEHQPTDSLSPLALSINGYLESSPALGEEDEQHASDQEGSPSPIKPHPLDPLGDFPAPDSDETLNVVRRKALALLSTVTEWVLPTGGTVQRKIIADSAESGLEDKRHVFDSHFNYEDPPTGETPHSLTNTSPPTPSLPSSVPLELEENPSVSDSVMNVGVVSQLEEDHSSIVSSSAESADRMIHSPQADQALEMSTVKHAPVRSASHDKPLTQNIALGISQGLKAPQQRIPPTQVSPVSASQEEGWIPSDYDYRRPLTASSPGARDIIYRMAQAYIRAVSEERKEH